MRTRREVAGAEPAPGQAWLQENEQRLHSFLARPGAYSWLPEARPQPIYRQPNKPNLAPGNQARGWPPKQTHPICGHPSPERNNCVPHLVIALITALRLATSI